ncbi:hypothetical protein AAY81_02290 [Denitrobacterium detoxificans]|nr:hypothetical protein AAY81_02290 [Denitrobacterium detoxificans]
MGEIAVAGSSIEKLYGKKKCQAAFAQGIPAKKLIDQLSEMVEDEDCFAQVFNDVSSQLRNFEDYAGLEEWAQKIAAYNDLRKKGAQVRLRTAADAYALIEYERAARVMTQGTSYNPDGSMAEIVDAAAGKAQGCTSEIGTTEGGIDLQFVFDEATAPRAAAVLYAYLWSPDSLKMLEGSFCSCTLNTIDALLELGAEDGAAKQLALLTYLSHTIGNFMPGTNAGGKGQFNAMRAEQERVQGYWDLTLMCIKAWYSNMQNPLGFPLKSGEAWWKSFGDWNGFIDANYLQDYVTVGEDGIYQVVPFYEGHSLAAPTPHGPEVAKCIQAMNVRIIARGLRMRYALSQRNAKSGDLSLFFNYQKK